MRFINDKVLIPQKKILLNTINFQKKLKSFG